MSEHDQEDRDQETEEQMTRRQTLNLLESLVERLNKFSINIRKTKREKLTEDYLLSKYATLEMLKIEFEKSARIYGSLTTKEERQILPFFVEDWPTTFEENYDTIREWMNGYLVFARREKIGSGSGQQPPQAPPHQNIVIAPVPPDTLKKVAIPVFDGEPENWPQFRDLFTSVVHNHATIGAVQKFQNLKAYVRGKAERVIREIMITEANYPLAWAAMLRAFNNPRLLVDNQLKLILESASVSSESASELKNLMYSVVNAYQAITNQELNINGWDYWVVFVVVRRLPFQTKILWEQSIANLANLPTFTLLQTFLEERCRTLDALQTTAPRISPSARPTSYAKSLRSVSSACAMCQKEHPTEKCYQFLKMSQPQRKTTVKDLRLCINCLTGGHYIKDCPRSSGCSKCSARHHDTLHIEKVLPEQASVHSTLTSLCVRQLVERKLFATVVVKISTQKQGTLTLRALVDSGSEVSFITSAAAQALGGGYERTNVPILGLSEALVGTSTQIKELELRSLYDDQVKIPVEAYVLPKVTSVSPPVTKQQRDSWSHLKGLQLADPYFDKAGPIDLLLDLGIYSKMLRSGLIVGENGAPSAANTIFGWLVFGTVSAGKGVSFTRPVKARLTSVQLDAQIRRFWEIEKIPYPELVAPDDKKCEELFQKEHKRRADGSYEVPLPLRSKYEGKSQLGDSAGAAKSRFLRLERAFERDSVLHAKYIEEMRSYFVLNQIEPVSEGDIEPGQKYSIPHHAVNNPGSKFRVVYDASCKTTSGKSLNDVTLVGPNLQVNLSEVITNWRKYQYCFQGDITKMYRQVHVIKSDQEYQRIFWRESKHVPLKEFKLTRLTFGVNASPYLAIRTLRQLAEDEKDHFPLARRPIIRETYMDDIRSGGDSLEEVENVLSQTVACLEAGGFPLRKILTNNKELLDKQPAEWIDPCTTIDLWAKDGVVKSLGVFWDTQRDVFTFRINSELLRRRESFTKRDLVSNVAMLFDPVGWISPVVLKAKLLIQEVWRESIGWDERVSPRLAEKWEEIRETLKHLETLSIPRWIGLRKGLRYQLHGFGDASQLAYATAVYIRVNLGSGYVVYLLSSKTRVAPLLMETIPRLELCAAVITVELLESLENVMGCPPERICLWSDSTIVLDWLHSAPIDWNTFVANRISKIQSTKLTLDFRHVPSEDNPADLGSRGCLAGELIDNDLWWNGPTWLSKSETCWPGIPSDSRKKAVEEVKVTRFTTPYKQYALLDRFSSWSRAKHAVAWCLRFISNCKRASEDRDRSILSVAELRSAELRLIKLDQETAFHFLKLERGVDILHQLHYHSSKKRRKLLKLSPFVDEHRILRVGGRLRNMKTNFDRSHPIILAETSKLTGIIVRDIHEMCCHSGTQTVLNLLRKKYWVMGGRATVQKILSTCIHCKRVEPRLLEQLMGQLPVERIALNQRAFEGVGVDFAGPIKIKASRLGSRATRSKNSHTAMIPSYIAVFVCLSTKAVHLEAVSELTTEAFLASLRRFIHRRGKPAVIYSDNGTNFRGADAKLKRDRWKALSRVSEDLKPELVDLGITWKYIAPNSPHAGGLWESAVKSMKRLMYRTIQNENLNFEELSTLLCQIEASMNSRPLYRLSEDPSDDEILTPNHFLNMGELMGLPDDPITWETRKLSLRGWKLVQKLGHTFWHKWKNEYLHTLQPKLKWLHRKGNLKVNDLVLIKDDDLPARKWLRGRIVELRPGTDGLVRVVKVKTAHSEFWRDVRHLALLPVAPVQ